VARYAQMASLTIEPGIMSDPYQPRFPLTSSQNLTNCKKG
jgi:hypothetical protein